MAGRDETKTKLLRRCPICLNDCGWILHHQSFETPENYPLPSEYDVVCCRKCRFVYADTPATQKEYTQFYKNLSKYEDNGGIKTTTNWTAEKLAPLVKYLRLGDRTRGVLPILDVGCANGELLMELKKLGFDQLVGLDLSKTCVQNVRGQGIKAFQGGLFSLPKDDFGCVVLSHVLEHVYDLRGAIDNIGDRATIVYAEVPDSSRYSDYYLTPFHFFDVEHINHFDEDSLNNLFLLRGFELLELVKKESHVAGEVYPAIHAIYRKKLFRATPFLFSGLKKYIEKSRWSNHWPKIDELAKSREPIAIWGVGSYAMRLLKQTSLGKCRISLLIDKDKKKEGWKIKGAAVSSNLSDLKEHSGPIVVCSALYHEEIAKEIKDMGLDNRVIIMK